MPKIKSIRHCSKCGEEIGELCYRYVSKNRTVKRLKDLFYCAKCGKFLKLKENFEEIEDVNVGVGEA